MARCACSVGLGESSNDIRTSCRFIISASGKKPSEQLRGWLTLSLFGFNQALRGTLPASYAEATC